MSRPRPRAGRAPGPARLVAFNKPAGVLSQWSDDPHWPGLARHLTLPGLYPAGRLDRDSEGLLLLTDDGALQSRLTDPASDTPKTYFALVEGQPGDAALAALRGGVVLADGPTRPALVEPVAAPGWLWPGAAGPGTWLSLTITEGRNRQIRRMAQAVGHKVLRLIRWSVGDHTLGALQPGQWRELRPDAILHR